MDSWIYWVGGIVVVSGVLLAVAAQNRRWGRPPTYPGGTAGIGESWQPPASAAPGGTEARWETWDNPPEPSAAGAAASGFASSPNPPPVRITNPHVRQAMEAALQRGGPGARYIIRDGDDLYFSFDAIPDAAERQATYELMRRFEAGEPVGVREMLLLGRRLTK